MRKVIEFCIIDVWDFFFHFLRIKENEFDLDNDMGHRGCDVYM